MKRITLIAVAGWMMLGIACNKQLDINQNPNSATTATAEAILPQALAGTAANLNGYNSYGAQLVGYMANAGGYGGFGTNLTYNFSASDYSGRWSATYDNLEDYQAIIDKTKDTLPAYSYYNAVARIMKAFNFQLLVDAYNDVPYFDALKGQKNLTPKYDPAAKIYTDLAAQIDTAISEINSAKASGLSIVKLAGTDIVFGGDMTKWKQFANSLKLRIIIRASGKTTFANTSFDPAGFLTTDALINPGYRRDNGRQNPEWDTWVFGSTGSDANKAWMPTKYVFGYYDGHKLLDEVRGPAIYYQFPATGVNQLGVQSVDVPKSPSGSFWYSGSERSGTSAGNAIGVIKGPDAGYPLMVASESYFLQAEAAVRGINLGAPADAKTLFNKGIRSSIRYSYLLPDGTLYKEQGAGGSVTPYTEQTIDELDSIYHDDNSGSYLVNFDLAASNAQKIEAIITQKYIALNMIAGQEAWNEYRRTGYPVSLGTAGATAYQTFASTDSQSTRPDRLPTRILYPSSEGSYNSTNVPKGISPFTSLIFWAQ